MIKLSMNDEKPLAAVLRAEIACLPDAPPSPPAAGAPLLPLRPNRLLMAVCALFEDEVALAQATRQTRPNRATPPPAGGETHENARAIDTPPHAAFEGNDGQQERGIRVFSEFVQQLAASLADERPSGRHGATAEKEQTPPDYLPYAPLRYFRDNSRGKSRAISLYMALGCLGLGVLCLALLVFQL